MLQAHSFLWNYLWVAPNVLLLVLAYLLWRRRRHTLYPAFFAFAVLGAIAELICYGADLAPWVSATAWWYFLWASMLVEGLLKFAVIAEIFGQTFQGYDSVSKLGKFLIRGLGAALIFAAALAAAFSPHDSQFGIIYGAHLVEQTIYLVETGLLVFIFAFGSYFHLRFSRPIFGISLGLAISACVHLAFWGVIANSSLPDTTRFRYEFLIMGTYHLVVLLWGYYLLVDPQDATRPVIVLPESNLAQWNRELERLLHQ